jgi:hypothetical protein
MQLGRELLLYPSPSAIDTPVRTMTRPTFSNISGNGVNLNEIATRGNEGFSSNLPQIHFSVPEETRQDV